MRSIPRALIWELLAHGHWGLILGVLGANAMPVLLFTALSHSGPIDVTDRSYVTMCVVLTQLHLFAFGAAVISAQGQPGRLYAAPIPTSTIVIWHMLPASVLMAVETILSTLALNSIFHLNWPLWGPAIFVAAALPAVQAAIWQTDKSPWLPLAVGTVAAMLGLWYQSRFGSFFRMPSHLWTTVTPIEVVTLGLVAVAAYYAATAGVARTRRGDILKPPGVVAWLGRVFDPPARSDQPFHSTAQAQFWFEWHQKGWLMPVAVAMGLMVGIGFWTLFVRNADDLFQGFIAGGGLLSAVAFAVSMIMGNTGSTDASYEMSHFLASRPLTNVDLSRTLLRVAARSILLAWGIWAAAFLVFYLISLTAGLSLSPKFPVNLLWLYFPATLLGPWIVVTAGMSLGLTGHRWIFIQTIFGGLTLFIGLNLLSQLAFSGEERFVFQRRCADAIGVLLSLGSAGVLIAARRRMLIRWRFVGLAAGFWVVLGSLLGFFSTQASSRPEGLLLGIGLLALAVIPGATTPLALAWNRSR